MRRIPVGVAWSVGLCAALFVAASVSALRPGWDRPAAPVAGAEDRVFPAAPESCVRYGRVECCYKGE